MTGVEVSPRSATIPVGGTKQLSATVQPPEASNKEVSWSSDSDGVAAVDKAGKVTAKSVGSAKITVTTGDGSKTAECSVTVNDRLTGATAGGTAKVGQKMTASVRPEGAQATFKWKQSDSSDGEYADIPGKTGASITLEDGQLGKYLKVEAAGSGNYTGTVLSPATAKVTKDVQAPTVAGEAKVGAQLTATAKPDGATAAFKWKRADSAEGAYSDIASATGATYTPVEDDQGKFLKVEATGTGNYTGAAMSAATSAVAAKG